MREIILSQIHNKAAKTRDVDKQQRKDVRYISQKIGFLEQRS